ncbi:hypothetical protein [Phaeobacter phage MD18]|nr:hypothetical protein [Phaeobacter phage MD18]
MALNQAATLDDQQFAKMMKNLAATVRRPSIETVVFLLSYKAGLRAQEIAGLEWNRHILDAEGNIRHEEFLVAGSKGRAKRERHPVLWISSDIGKYGSERTLRMHPILFEAIKVLREEGNPGIHVIPSGNKRASQNLKSRAHALTIRINRYYARMGLEKCSSHSGRRTFITKAARTANYANCSLADVQQMAGHRQLTTTEGYIDTTSQQADLIGLL